MRKQKRIVNIGGVKIGGDNPVAIHLLLNRSAAGCDRKPRG